MVGSGKTSLPVSRSLKSDDLDPLKPAPDRIKIACNSKKVTVPFIMYPTNLPSTESSQNESDPLALEEEPKEPIEVPKPNEAKTSTSQVDPLEYKKVRCPVEKTRQCKLCDKRFRYDNDLRAHLRAHAGIKPFKCDYCDKAFTRRQSLTEHLNLHTGKQLHQCQHCTKVFTRADKLRIHQLSQHPELSNPGEVALSKSRHKCDSCDMTFAYKSYLTAHIKIVHEKAKPFSCETCGKKFAKQHRLKEHLPIHSGEKAFKCEICKKEFSRKQTLKNHMKYHTGENLFPCDMCGQEFNVRVNLVEHMRVHTGEKLFECHKCGKKFARKYSYKVHMRDVEKVEVRNEDLPSAHGLIVSDDNFIESSMNQNTEDKVHDVKDIETVIFNSNETLYCEDSSNPLHIKTEETL